jgi:hypothetical protein
MRIIFALLSLVAGLLLIFSGYRLARYLIPLIGFIAGLSLGGAITADIAGTVFLGTALGIFMGIILGLVLAAIAYFYYSLAVIVLAGGLGYWAGSSFILALGFNPGVLSVVAGVALGCIVGMLAIFYNAPKYVLVLMTSVVGAVAAVGGTLLLFNKIPLDAYSYTTAHLAISNSFIWTVVALALIVVGVVSQVRSTENYTFERWAVGHDHNLPQATHHVH